MLLILSCRDCSELLASLNLFDCLNALTSSILGIIEFKTSLSFSDIGLCINPSGSGSTSTGLSGAGAGSEGCSCSNSCSALSIASCSNLDLCSSVKIGVVGSVSACFSCSNSCFALSIASSSNLSLSSSCFALSIASASACSLPTCCSNCSNSLSSAKSLSDEAILVLNLLTESSTKGILFSISNCLASYLSVLSSACSLVKPCSEVRGSVYVLLNTPDVGHLLTLDASVSCRSSNSCVN